MYRCTDAQMYRTEFWTLWEKARVGCFERTASKHVYYLGWNRSPAQVGCMKQVLGPGALGRPRGIGWRGRWEGGSGWGIHVTPWLIHVNVWQKPLQYCKVIGLQLIKKNENKKTLMLGKIEGKRRRGKQRLRLLGSITYSMDMNLSKLWEIVKDRWAWRAVVHGVSQSQTRLSDWPELNCSIHQGLAVCLSCI